ncbi:patatin-like phospholipase family protein [bacterium]|nr:patatin-like phospholipase family protein [bacterium]
MHSFGRPHIGAVIALFLLPWTLFGQTGQVPDANRANLITQQLRARSQQSSGSRAMFARATATQSTSAHPRVPKIGLVLSGGGSRGIAQIGVIKALEDAGIVPDFIVGTSVGSIIGGLYACGYSADRLEHSIRTIDWNNVLQLRDEADRSLLTVDQKPVSDRSILTMRLDGLQPVIPLAVSNGQRLTNMLNELALQGTHYARNFDDLQIPFRAVATDLYSGKRVVLSSGSLAEAMRSSSTIPVMFSPVTMDSMALVDGGLLSNIPVDVAVDQGCDIIIAVNTTSPLRRNDEITNPLETLDQVFNVMMQNRIDEELAPADFIISPPLDGFGGTNFDHIDSLLLLGYEAGRAMLPALRDTIFSRMISAMPVPSSAEGYRAVVCTSPLCSDDSWFSSSHSVEDIQRKAVELQLRPDVLGVELTYDNSNTVHLEVRSAMHIGSIVLHGNTILPEAAISGIESRWVGAPWTAVSRSSFERYVLEDYRIRGYSLAAIDSMARHGDGSVHVYIREGRIGHILVQGNTRTDRVVILRELPLKEGGRFRINDLKRGMDNLAGLNLFHYVTFDLVPNEEAADLIIRVIERPSQMLQVGLLVDNERNAQIGLVLRDANFFGTGTELASTFFSGDQNRRYGLRYNTNRLFYSPFTLRVEGYYGFKDFNNYKDVTDLPSYRFEREVASVTRHITYGGAASLGMNVERIGNLLATFRYEQQNVRTDQIRRMDADMVDEKNLVVSMSISSTIDTQDRYPYPCQGLFFTAEYRSAQIPLGSEVAFSRIESSYELYVPLIEHSLVVHPRFMFGYGDKTMPRSEEFRLGGLSSFIGMRENEYNGRQLAVGSLEFRYQLPIAILFDSYLSFRYDLGRTWANPELIKIEDLRHGAGLILGLDTPIGPADFAIGRSFYFLRNNPSTPARWGPLNLYFSIGVELD